MTSRLDDTTTALLIEAANELDHVHADHRDRTTVGVPIAIIQPLAAMLRWVAGAPRPNLTDSAVTIARAITGTADPGGAAPASSNTPGAGE